MYTDWYWVVTWDNFCVKLEALSREFWITSCESRNEYWQLQVTSLWTFKPCCDLWEMNTDNLWLCWLSRWLLLWTFNNSLLLRLREVNTDNFCRLCCELSKTLLARNKYWKLAVTLSWTFNNFLQKNYDSFLWSSRELTITLLQEIIL